MYCTREMSSSVSVVPSILIPPSSCAWRSIPSLYLSNSFPSYSSNPAHCFMHGIHSALPQPPFLPFRCIQSAVPLSRSSCLPPARLCSGCSEQTCCKKSNPFIEEREREIEGTRVIESQPRNSGTQLFPGLMRLAVWQIIHSVKIRTSKNSIQRPGLGALEFVNLFPTFSMPSVSMPRYPLIFRMRAAFSLSAGEKQLFVEPVVAISILRSNLISKRCDLVGMGKKCTLKALNDRKGVK